MTNQKGSISIHTENIFPIIKKWLYSDKDIFIRELISNGCDAVNKYKKLISLGEAKGNADENYKIKVSIDKENSALIFEDNGIGMTAEEVEKYINQVAFSGAEDFIEKYKDNITNVLDLLVNYFRDIMMVKENVDSSMIINLDRLVFIKNMSTKITYSQLSKIIDIIEETKNKLRSNCNFNISIQVMTLNIYEVIK